MSKRWVASTAQRSESEVEGVWELRTQEVVWVDVGTFTQGLRSFGLYRFLVSMERGVS